MDNLAEKVEELSRMNDDEFEDELPSQAKSLASFLRGYEWDTPAEQLKLTTQAMKSRMSANVDNKELRHCIWLHAALMAPEPSEEVWAARRAEWELHRQKRVMEGKDPLPFPLWLAQQKNFSVDGAVPVAAVHDGGDGAVHDGGDGAVHDGGDAPLPDVPVDDSGPEINTGDERGGGPPVEIDLELVCSGCALGHFACVSSVR